MPPFWTIGCLYGASSVMLGAFGAHGLKKRIADPSRIGTIMSSYSTATAKCFQQTGAPQHNTSSSTQQC